jgi:hypothetical protein
MKSRFYRTAAPLITRIQKLFSEDLAKENDFLRQGSKILRSKLCKRVPLTDSDPYVKFNIGVVDFEIMCTNRTHWRLFFALSFRLGDMRNGVQALNDRSFWSQRIETGRRQSLALVLARWVANFT